MRFGRLLGGVLESCVEHGRSEPEIIRPLAAVVAQLTAWAVKHYVTAHITEYGMCARDWLSQPCVRHGACAACEKQPIRKGDLEHRKSIARSLRENLILLERARAEDEDGQRVPRNHARHLAREVAALKATMSVHDNPSIADGSYVQLDLPALAAEGTT